MSCTCLAVEILDSESTRNTVFTCLLFRLRCPINHVFKVPIMSTNWEHKSNLTGHYHITVIINVYYITIWIHTRSILIPVTKAFCLQTSSWPQSKWRCVLPTQWMLQSKYIHVCADASRGKANNINAGRYQHMHPAISSIQQLRIQSLHSGTPQCKSLQLQASRVTATVHPNCVHMGCSKAANVNTTLTYHLHWAGTGSGWPRLQLSGIVRVYRCTS